MSIGILGGGIAGLTLGDQFGSDSLILEKEEELGGLARSFKSEGYVFDRGSHIIFSRDDDILRWMINQLDSNLLKNKRDARIYYKGIFVKYPFENDLASIPLNDRYECLIGYVRALVASKNLTVSKSSTFEDWIIRTFGEGIANHYLIPYNCKVWNLHPREMSAHWVEGRIPMPPPEDIVRSALGIDTVGYAHQAEFYYPRDGGIQAFAEAIHKNGKSSAHCNETVTKIAKTSGGWIVETDHDKYSFDLLFNTLPLYLLPDLINTLPDSVKNAIYNLRSNAAWLVMIGVENQMISPFSWMYFPRQDEGLFNRISFPKNFSPQTSPSGKSSILAEITCNLNDKVWSMTTEDIINVTINDLIRLGIIDDKRSIDFTHAIKTPLAYVVYDIDYLKKIEIVQSYFKKLGIINVGRFAEFVYYNMDGVIKSAFEKASPFLKQQ